MNMDASEMLDFMWNNEALMIQWMSYIMIVVSAVVLVLLQCVDAPYGRYTSSSWGCLINGKVAWIIQELPALIIPLSLLVWTYGNIPTGNVMLLTMFLIHYTQRALIFPMLISGGKPTPFIPFALAFIFCLYNGLMQGRYLTNIATYPTNWTNDVRFLLGSAAFASGMFINIQSDHILRNLRKPGETGYKIPKGGMFEYVSGANFFGEILEWGGFALASWSWPGLAFFLFTAFNIGPRACSHHRWYLQKFDDYPASRRAVIPFIW